MMLYALFNAPKRKGCAVLTYEHNSHLNNKTYTTDSTYRICVELYLPLHGNVRLEMCLVLNRFACCFRL